MLLYLFIQGINNVSLDSNFTCNSLFGRFRILDYLYGKEAKNRKIKMTKDTSLQVFFIIIMQHKN